MIVKLTPTKPNKIATIGSDINPAVCPCEFETVAVIIIAVTIVAIIEFLHIPTVKGIIPQKKLWKELSSFE